MQNSKNRFIRKSVLFLTILFSIVPAFLKAQTPIETYEFAQNLSRQGNYGLAIKAFKRIQFFDDINQFPGVYKVLADCYFNEADYESAYYYYDLASVQPGNDSLLPDLEARKVSCKLFSQQYQEALIDILSFEGRMNSRQQWQMLMLEGITYFYLNEYALSEQAFLKTADSSQRMLSGNVTQSFKKIRHLEKRYNPKVARVLSIILPGSGQMMAGDFRNGLNSFLLVGGLVSTSFLFSGTINLFDSFFIIAPWFQRYYMGGYQRAFEITIAKQRSEKNNELAKMVKMLNQPNLP